MEVEDLDNGRESHERSDFQPPHVINYGRGRGGLASNRGISKRKATKNGKFLKSNKNGKEVWESPK